MAKTFVTLALTILYMIWGVSSHDQVSNGQCVMYGLCGLSPTTSLPIPCVYNGPAKPLTDPTARRILEEMCPDLAHDKSTCCDSSQLIELLHNFEVPRQILSRCPACLHNFQNIYCYMLCGSNQSKYLAVTKIFNSTSVNVLHYDLTTTFANAMFNSCKDVQMPSAGERAIGVLCGRPADKCTPKLWLDYMGSTSNGQTPFEIDFNITDQPETLPSGTTLHPMNATAVPCSSPVGKKSACSCQDCGNFPCTTTLPPMVPIYPCTTGPDVKAIHRRQAKVPGYQSISLVIQRLGHHAPIKHLFPPPSDVVIMFNAIFEKIFLHQILDFLTTVQAMNVSLHETYVSLNDVCLHDPDSKRCVIPSMLQYYQNSHRNIDKVIMDQTGFYVAADYLDHLLVCFRHPEVKNDSLPLNMPCVSDYGGVVTPPKVFCGYGGNHYQNSTAHVLTFVIKDPSMSEAGAAWRTGLLDFVVKWQATHEDVVITTYQPKQ